MFKKFYDPRILSFEVSTKIWEIASGYWLIPSWQVKSWTSTNQAIMALKCQEIRGQNNR